MEQASRRQAVDIKLRSEGQEIGTQHRKTIHPNRTVEKGGVECVVKLFIRARFLAKVCSKFVVNCADLNHKHVLSLTEMHLAC